MQMPRRTALLAALSVFVVLSGCNDAGLLAPADEGASLEDSGEIVLGKNGERFVRGRYIVVFKDDIASPRAEARRITEGLAGQPIAVYEHAIKGFAITNVPDAAAAALARHPSVKYVEQDRVVELFVQTLPAGVRRIFADDNANIDIDGSDDLRVDVDVAIIDTGIDFEHPDLHVVAGQDCSNLSCGGPPWSRTAVCDNGGDDDHYHGTHVAGTVAALDNGDGVVGVAPGARLWAVKVLNSSGSAYESNIVAGIDWVTQNAAEIEVANMSLGGSGFSQAEYDAIQSAVNAGVAFAVAAGNSDADASGYSPAAFDNVLTVSALADFDGEPGGNGSSTCRTDQDDTLADFSNWGSAVQIAAPGACILSTYPIEQGSYGTISGTSMASPHVAGALALLASSNNPGNASQVQNLYDAVVNAGNFNWTDDSGDGIKEPLLDVTGFNPTMVGGGGGGEPTDDPPTVTITSPANGSSFDSGTSISIAGSASDDEDGNVTGSLVWTSSLDGQIGTGGSFDAVLTDGTHTVTASLTDSGGNPGSDAISVTIAAEPPPTGDFTLSVSAYKTRGIQTADQTWTGATSTNVDVYFNGDAVATTANDGFHTHSTGTRGGGSGTYRVCEAGTSTCSNDATANW